MKYELYALLEYLRGGAYFVEWFKCSYTGRHALTDNASS